MAEEAGKPDMETVYTADLGFSRLLCDSYTAVQTYRSRVGRGDGWGRAGRGVGAPGEEDQGPLAVLGSPSQWLHDVYTVCHYTYTDLVVVLSIAVALTLVRYVCSATVYRVSTSGE